jgi:hypothetical protein
MQIRSLTDRTLDLHARRTEPSEPAQVSRALVPVAPAQAPHADFSGPRRSAAFLTQLIAGHVQMPQTREKRRAEPGDAITAYRAASSRNLARAGRRLSEAL